jgi:hypothetical protein
MEVTAIRLFTFVKVAGKGDAAQAVAAKDSVRTPESIESAKTAATAKSLEELKKDLGVKEGAQGKWPRFPTRLCSRLIPTNCVLTRQIYSRSEPS